MAERQTHIGPESCAESTRTNLDECTEIFCAPETIKLSITDPSDVFSCERETAAYRAFTYKSESVGLRISFDPALARDNQANSLLEGFNHLSVDVFVPQEHNDARFKDLDFLVLRNSGEFEELEFSDNRVQAKATLDISRVYYERESNEPDCRSGDIQGICACIYDVPFKVEIEIDMALSAIETCRQGY